MDAASKQQDLERISAELQKLTVQRDQLNNRLRLLALLKELRQTTGCSKEENAPPEKGEYEKIEEELKELSERKLELHALWEKLEESLSGDTFNTLQIRDPLTNEIFTVERPPSYPAPDIITDVKNLPLHSSAIQCPFCKQYVITEVSTVAGNTAWLVCMMLTFICCIAGCCLFPFCISTYKDVVHKCPKCRSHLHTCTKM